MILLIHFESYKDYQVVRVKRDSYGYVRSLKYELIGILYTDMEIIYMRFEIRTDKNRQME